MKKHTSKKFRATQKLNNKRKSQWLNTKSGTNAKSPLPLEYTATFNLTTTINLAGTGPQTYTYRLNSLASPDYTSGGQQPYYFDQFAALYTKYRVYSTAVDIQASSSNNTYSQLLAMVPSQSSNVFTSVPQASEFPASKTIMLAPVGSGKSLMRMRGSYNVAKILGYSANIDDDLSATVSTSPSKVLYLQLIVDTIPSANTAGCQCWLKFRFRAKFYGPALLSVSYTMPQPKDKSEDDDGNFDSILSFRVNRSTVEKLGVNNMIKNK